MTSNPSFNKLLKLIQYFCKCCGCDVLSDDFKVTFPLCIAIFLVIIYYALFFYTIYFYSEDFIMIVQSLVTIGLGFQLVIKLYIAMIHGSKMRDSINFVKDNLYKRFEDGTFEQKRIVKKCAEQNYLLGRIMMLLYLLSSLLFAIYPMYMYLFEGTLEIAIPLLIPLIDHTSTKGYFYTMILQFSMLFFAVIGAVAADAVFLVLTFHTTAFADIFRTQLKELRDYLRDAEMDSDFPRNEELVKDKLRDIFKEHQDYIHYVETVDDIYFWTCLVQVGSSYISLAVSVFLVIVTKWYAVYGFVLALTFQLFLFCIFGTIVDIKNEEMRTSIYNFPWHLLKNEDQKSYLIMIHKSQNARILTAGGMTPMNVELFMEIMKQIYQLSMMMLNFLE